MSNKSFRFNIEDDQKLADIRTIFKMESSQDIEVIRFALTVLAGMPSIAPANAVRNTVAENTLFTPQKKNYTQEQIDSFIKAGRLGQAIKCPLHPGSWLYNDGCWQNEDFPDKLKSL